MSMSQNVESQAVVQELKGQVRGPVLQPGDAEFDEARSVWNAMIDRRPALIVRCLGVSDVVACVNAARTTAFRSPSKAAATTSPASPSATVG